MLNAATTASVVLMRNARLMPIEKLSLRLPLRRAVKIARAPIMSISSSSSILASGLDFRASHHASALIYLHKVGVLPDIGQDELVHYLPFNLARAISVKAFWLTCYNVLVH